MQRLLPLFSAKSPAILEKWLDILLGSYSPQTVQFLKKEKDPFGNPVAHQLSRGLGDLLAVLVEEKSVEEARTALDEIIRVLALQETAPSQALAFIFHLKQVVRDELAEELKTLPWPRRWRTWSPASTGWPSWGLTATCCAGRS